MHMKGSKECYILGQKHNLQIFGVIPFIKPQNKNTKQKRDHPEHLQIVFLPY